MVSNRNIVTCILLTVVTCGIYGIIWCITLADDVKNASQDSSLPSGGMLILLTIITCGIYSFYWFYKAGLAMNQVRANIGLQNDESRPILYLILGVVQLGIVGFCLIQDDLNKYAVAQNQ